MITSEQDDVVLWGLQLFETDPYTNYVYCDNNAGQDDEHYGSTLHYGVDYGAECCNVEHDELIARILQDEFAQLLVAEAPESSHGGDGYPQVSDFQQHWLGQSALLGQDGGQEEIDDMRCSGSCCSPQESLCNGKELTKLSELTYEYASDEELEKWLNHMVPIRHVPRLNG